MDYQDREQVAIAIISRVTAMRKRRVLTSKDELMSLAAIGRTCEPPVSKTAVSRVANGIDETARIRRAIERELGVSFWAREDRRMAIGDRRGAI